MAEADKQIAKSMLDCKTLTLVFLFLCFFARFILEYRPRNESAPDLLL